MTSRSVRMAEIASPSSRTTAPTPRSAIAAAASPIVDSAEIVNRLRVMWSATRGTRRFYDPAMENAGVPRAIGRCLCGAVTYEVRGPLRDIVLCHCVEYRRWSGHIGAFSATRLEHLVIGETAALRWVDSPDSNRDARRGSCTD